uniref:Uncharacterized protein n=1 Tax=Romanomermis culicivorax TaxID=13658 RepID=A0A915IWJ2_ROMCU
MEVARSLRSSDFRISKSGFWFCIVKANNCAVKPAFVVEKLISVIIAFASGVKSMSAFRIFYVTLAKIGLLKKNGMNLANVHQKGISNRKFRINSPSKRVIKFSALLTISVSRSRSIFICVASFVLFSKRAFNSATFSSTKIIYFNKLAFSFSSGSIFSKIDAYARLALTQAANGAAAADALFAFLKVEKIFKSIKTEPRSLRFSLACRFNKATSSRAPSSFETPPCMEFDENMNQERKYELKTIVEKTFRSIFQQSNKKSTKNSDKSQYGADLKTFTNSFNKSSPPVFALILSKSKGTDVPIVVSNGFLANNVLATLGIIIISKYYGYENRKKKPYPRANFGVITFIWCKLAKMDNVERLPTPGSPTQSIEPQPLVNIRSIWPENLERVEIYHPLFR